MEDKYKSELKKLYRLSSKISGRYKKLYQETSRFTIGLLDTSIYEEGLSFCSDIEDMIEDTDIYN